MAAPSTALRHDDPDAPAGATTRSRILAAAAHVFAQHGAAGATTRRIAERAEVNEVTLFRLFGSKEALLDAAVHASAARERPAALPASPADPLRELTAWCAAELARLRGSAELLRQCFAEAGEHAAHVHDAGGAIGAGAGVLREYVARLAERSPLGAPADREVAVTMLASTIVADALGRDALPGVHTTPAADVPERYARGFLRMLGVPNAAAARWEWAPPDGEGAGG
jgi:AcrR family transcriptional regulator